MSHAWVQLSGVAGGAGTRQPRSASSSAVHDSVGLERDAHVAHSRYATYSASQSGLLAPVKRQVVTQSGSAGSHASHSASQRCLITVVGSAAPLPPVPLPPLPSSPPVPAVKPAAI